MEESFLGKLQIKDLMYDFFQNPIRENFTKLIDTHTGEQNNIDFKSEWIKGNKLAQIMLGMANTGGGVIIFGVKEHDDGTTEANGLEKLEDKSKSSSQIRRYIPDNLKFEIMDFDYSGEEYSKLKDRKFQVLLVTKDDECLPYICTKAGDDTKEGTIYVRRGTGTYPANQTEIQKILDKKLKSMYSSISDLELQEHINQLKILYKNIEKPTSYFKAANILSGFSESMTKTVGASMIKGVNEKYPKEGFEDFIVRLIEEKKHKIERVLNLK